MKKVILAFVLFTCILSIKAVSVDFNFTEVCSGDTTFLTGISDISDNKIALWEWDLDDDGYFDDATGKNIAYIFSYADSILVSLQIITTEGIEYRMNNSRQVIVNPLPEVAFLADNFCEKQAVTFTNLSTIRKGTISNFSWDFNNDRQADANCSSTVQYHFNATGEYTVTLQAISDNNCISQASQNITIYPQPIAGFNTINACINDTISLTNTSTIDNGYIETYLWNFGDGEQSLSVDGQHCYNKAGLFTVSLIIISENECRDTAVCEIEIFNPPELMLDYAGDTIIIYEGEAVTLNITGDFCDALWSTGETSYSIEVNDSGVYSIVVSNENQCINTDFTTVLILAKSEELISNNLLTPNNDEINDNLEINELESYSNCKLVVYSIWGDIIFSSNSYQNDWPSNHSSHLETGTYYYVVKCDGNKHETGTINIFGN